MRKLTYFVGSTIDGFIADTQGSIDAFFPLPDGMVEFLAKEYPETVPTAVRDQFGISGENQQFDTMVMGRMTYEPGLAAGVTSPYAHLEQYVASRSIGESPDPTVHVVGDDLVGTVQRLKQRPGKGIWLAGGAQLATALVDEIDELVVKVYPFVLGSGTPMFSKESGPVRFTLRDSLILSGGAAVLSYSR